MKVFHPVGPQRIEFRVDLLKYQWYQQFYLEPDHKLFDVVAGCDSLEHGVVTQSPKQLLYSFMHPRSPKGQYRQHWAVAPVRW